MKRLDIYLLRAVAPALGLGLLLYSSLVVLSATLPRLQWIVGVPWAQLTIWLLLQLPAALVQTAPVALVLAVLLVFGKLSSDRELAALRAGGVSLARASRAFAFLAATLTLVTLAMNEFVLPWANAQVGSVYWQLTSGDGRSGLFRLVKRSLPLGEYSLYFEEARADDSLVGVRLESWDAKTLTVLFAEQASFTGDGLELRAYQLTTLDFGALTDADLAAENDLEDLISRVVRRYSEASGPEQSLTVSMSEGVDELITNYAQGGFEDSRSLSDLYQDSRQGASPEMRRRASSLFQRKLAEPFANLVLLLTAVPLSLLYVSNRAVAFGVSLAVTLVWYLLFSFGQLYAQAGQMVPWLGAWGANILLALVGLGLLVKLQRR